MNVKNKNSILDWFRSQWWLEDENSRLDRFTEKIIVNIVCKKLSTPMKQCILKIIIIIGLFISKIFIIYNQRWLPTYIIQGIGKNSKEKLSIMYIGCESYSDFFFDIIYSEKIRQRKIGRTHIKKIDTKIKKISEEIDLILIQNDKFYRDIIEKQGAAISGKEY